MLASVPCGLDVTAACVQTRTVRRILAALSVACAASGVAHAGSLDLGFGGGSARLAFGWPLVGERLEGEASWLHDDSDGDVAGFGVHAVGDATFAKNLDGGIGGRLFWADGDGENGYGLMLGGFFRWGFAQEGRLSLTLDGHIAPNVFTAGNLRGYREAGARLGYRVLTAADVFVGYRYAEAVPEDGPDVKIASDVHFGFRLEF